MVVGALSDAFSGIEGFVGLNGTFMQWLMHSHWGVKTGAVFLFGFYVFMVAARFWHEWREGESHMFKSLLLLWALLFLAFGDVRAVIYPVSVGLVLVKIFSLEHSRRANIQTGVERRVDRRHPWARQAGGAERNVETVEESVAEKAHEAAEELEDEESEDRKEAREAHEVPAEAETDEAAAALTKELEGSTEEQKALERVKERITDTLAGVADSIQNIKQWIARSDRVYRGWIEIDMSHERINNALARYKSLNAIDSAMRRIIKNRFFNNVLNHVRDAKRLMEWKEALDKQLLSRVRESLRAIEQAVNAAKIKDNEVNDLEKRFNNKHKQAAKDIAKAIKDREKMIKKAQSSAKGKTSVAAFNVAKLQEEVAMLSRVHDVVKEAEENFDGIYEKMRKGVRFLKRLLKRMQNEENKLPKHREAIDKLARRVEKQEAKLDKEAKAVEEAQKYVNSVDVPEEILAKLTHVIMDFFDKRLQIIQDEMKVDKSIYNILLTDVRLANDIAAVEELMIMLDKGFQAADNGVAALLASVGAFIGNPQGQFKLKQVQAAIRQASKVLDYDESMQLFVRKVAQRVGAEGKEAEERCLALINEMQRIAEYAERDRKNYADTLGSLMVVVVEKKVEEGHKSLKYSDEFLRRMRDSRSDVATAFSKYRKLRRQRPKAQEMKLAA